ncbi:MAG: hypothetical protein HYX67_11455 [Candidatus Melainabacteria bacterium]|nr:hypothetical protein [Candidatus Melainabacteria bacterium]
MIGKVRTKTVIALLVCLGFGTTSKCLAGGGVTFTPTLGAETPSFYGIKQSFFQYAPHVRRESTNQPFAPEVGSDPTTTYQAPNQSGMVSSGRTPSITTPPSSTQAQQVITGQPVAHPFMQREMTVYSNPLKNNWGPPTSSDPYMHVLPHDPILQGINASTFTDMPAMTGALPSDLVAHTAKLVAAQRTAQQVLNPNLQSAQASYQGAAQQTADATQGSASAAFQANLNATSSPLINVANEIVASPPNKGNTTRTMSQSIWIVQQMYKAFFLPLGVLLLLVGAILTQTKNYVAASFASSMSTSWQPFEGILRAMVAVFLLGTIQLLVSYSIDFGNSMTDAVKQVIDLQSVDKWSQDLMNPTKNMTAAQIDARNKNESTASSTTRAVFGGVQAFLNTALMVLTTYQLVAICYLFLLGPVAAAMFAWPEGVGTLFRPVFGNWINALSDIILWRFWWCIILLCMGTRIQWLKDIGSYDPSSPWEPLVYTAFMVMLAYVPFSALDFRPGDMVDSLLQKATGSKAS